MSTKLYRLHNAVTNQASRHTALGQFGHLNIFREVCRLDLPGSFTGKVANDTAVRWVRARSCCFHNQPSGLHHLLIVG